MATAVSPAAKNKGKCGAFICVMGFVVLQFKLWPDKYADIVIYIPVSSSITLVGSVADPHRFLGIWIRKENFATWDPGTKQGFTEFRNFLKNIKNHLIFLYQDKIII